MDALMKTGFLSATAGTLIVSDDADARQGVQRSLRGEGFLLFLADQLGEVMPLLREEWIELLIVDCGADIEAVQRLCRSVRRDPALCDIAIVMVGQSVGDQQVVSGLWAGADEFIAIPIPRSVMVARLKSVLRRRAAGVCGWHSDDRAEKGAVRLGKLIIDPGKFEAYLSGRLLGLTAAEFRLLRLLASRPGYVFTRDRIVDALKGHAADTTLRAVDSRIYALRGKLGPDGGRIIDTVRGAGYRLLPPR